MEKKHEMMSLEDSEQLKGRMKFFEKELVENHHIDPNLYVEYDVKRGLRDSAGKGVLTGLTEISDVTGYKPVSYTHLDVYKRQPVRPCQNLQKRSVRRWA